MTTNSHVKTSNVKKTLTSRLLWNKQLSVVVSRANNIKPHYNTRRRVRERRDNAARLIKLRLPSVSIGRPQLLRTNIRHAVAAYGLMVTVQSELRRSAVRNAARKTARVISAALCTPPNDRLPTGPYCSPSQPFRRMHASGMPEKRTSQSTLPHREKEREKVSRIKTLSFSLHSPVSHSENVFKFMETN